MAAASVRYPPATFDALRRRAHGLRLADLRAHTENARARKAMREVAVCHLYASQSPSSYAFETRSIRLNGQSTSVRLEKIFWTILGEIAAREGLSVPRFISLLHDEVLTLRGEAPNFTSHLRCICLVAMESRLSEPTSAAA